MVESDGLIFGTPNHVGSATAPMINFLSPMLPLLNLKVEQDDAGKVVGGAFDGRLNGKRGAILISQEDPTISSILVFSLMERTFIEFLVDTGWRSSQSGKRDLGRSKREKAGLKCRFFPWDNLGFIKDE